MLCLTRKPGTRVMIGNDIVLTVISIDRNKVRLGIKAPANTLVLREELVGRDAIDRSPDVPPSNPP